MPETNPWLFGPAEPPASSASRSLVIQPTKGRPLSKAERAFNSALAKVQTLGRGLDEERRGLERLLIFHAAEIRPRDERAGELRSALLRALVPFLDDRRLKGADRRVLRDIVIAQLDMVLARVEQPDLDLQAIFERIHGLTYAQAMQEDFEDIRDGLADMFGELGLDVDVPELRPDMTEEDVAAAAARLAEQLHRAQDMNSAATARRPTKRQLREEDRLRQQEQLRKDSLGAVYRRLVKELHPDLEANPAERERKNRIIQDVTAAYARRDLHALLRLELEWLEGAGDAARLSEDTLRAHTAMLKQQARELETEIQSLRLHPRYAPLLLDAPWGIPTVLDGPADARRLDLEIEQMRSALGRLSSAEALDEVRGAVRAYRETQKRDAQRRPRR